MEVQVPVILLKRNSLEQLDSFRPETMSLQLSERQSTASFTVGPEAPEIAVGDWMMDDTDPGRGIVWRVRTVDTSYEKNTRTVSLEHMVQALKDRVMFGDVTPAMMGGGETCTARQAAEYILDRCPQWTLGSFGYNVSNPYSFNGDDLLSALNTVSSSLADPWWEYDFSVYPFRLSIRKRSEAVGTEMRMGRNISTARMSVDRSRMYTRIYPIGKNNLHISGNYLQKNTADFGIICKVQTNQNKETEAELRRWAQELLDRHAVPAVTVTIAGADLSRETGEDLDRITLGALCRVPLPGHGTTVTETVTKLSWSDKMREPSRVTVTLASEKEDVASIVNNLTATSSATSGSGAGGRGGAKQKEEDHAWITDTADHVSITAEKIFGKDGKDADGNINWGRVANITVDERGIHGTVTRTEGGLVKAQSAIEQLEESISLIVDGSGVVTPAQLILAINGNKSSAKLSADQILISGNTTVAGVMKVDGGNLMVSKNIYTGLGGGYVQTSGLRLVGSGSSQGAAVVSLTAGKMAKAVSEASVKGNTLHLVLMDGTQVDFSKAVSLEGAWDGGRKFTADAYQQNSGKRTKVGSAYTTLYQSVSESDTTLEADGHTLSANIRAVTVSGGRSRTEMAGTVRVDGSRAYRAGQATRPTVATSTSRDPSGATYLQSDIYVSSSTKSIIISVGGNRWYARVST